MNSREEDLQLFVSWEEGNNHSTPVLPLLKGDESYFSTRSSRRSWREPRDVPAPALGAAGCSVPGRRAKRLWEPPQPGISQTSHVSFLPRSHGTGTETAEAQPQQEKFHLSREGREAPARELGHRRNKLRCPGMDQTQVKQMDSGSFVGFLNENKIHFRSDLSNQSVLLC